MTLKQVRMYDPEPKSSDFTFRGTVVLDVDTLFSAHLRRAADEVGKIFGPDRKEMPHGPMVELSFTSGSDWKTVTVDVGQYKELTGMSVPEDWWSEG